MEAPPSTAEVGGPPPAQKPPDIPSVHSLSASELAETNLYIQTTAVDQRQISKSSSPVVNEQSLMVVTDLHQHPSTPPKPRPNFHLKQSLAEKPADLDKSAKVSSPASVTLPPTIGNFVLVPSSISSKPRRDVNLVQSSPSMAAIDEKLGQSFKSPSPANGNNKQPAAMASKPSFAEVAKNGLINNKRKYGPALHTFGQPTPLPGANIITKDGVDILVFEDEATDILAASYKWALVGKFSHNLPNIQTVGKFFSNLKLRGEFELKWLSHRQIIIILTVEEDYALIWTKGFWSIDGCSMRALKWTPTFNARIECPFAPVWVSLPGLPVHLFEKRALHLLACQLGRPLMVDTPTATRLRASMARICVEINLLSPLKNVITLCINGCLLEQPVIYEEVPSYCAHCRHIGHAEDRCFVKFEELKIVYDELQAEKKRKNKGKDKMDLDVLVTNPTSSSNAHANESELLGSVPSTGFMVNSFMGNQAEVVGTIEVVHVDAQPLHDDIHSLIDRSAQDSVLALVGDHGEEGGFFSGSEALAHSQSQSASMLEDAGLVNSDAAVGFISRNILVHDSVAEDVFMLSPEVQLLSSGADSKFIHVLTDIAVPDAPLNPKIDRTEGDVILDERSTAIVNFLSPFGVGSNMASVMESEPVALIKFLDKHPSMKLYWDENSVLQCVDKASGEFIDYAGVNSSKGQ